MEMNNYDHSVWQVTCERTGVLTPIGLAYLVYDRNEQRWLIIGECAEERVTDYAVPIHQFIGIDKLNLHMLLHVGEKVWFNPIDFAYAISRVYMQLYRKDA
jgi:hypothetical protein